MNSRWYYIEVIVLSAPVTAFLVWALPFCLASASTIFFWGDDNSLLYHLINSFEAIALWSAGAFSMVVLYSLALSTAMGHRFKFGLVFWAAVAIGIGCIVYLALFFGSVVAALLSVPLCMLAAHSIYIQARVLAKP